MAHSPFTLVGFWTTTIPIVINDNPERATMLVDLVKKEIATDVNEDLLQFEFEVEVSDSLFSA